MNVQYSLPAQAGILNVQYSILNVQCSVKLPQVYIRIIPDIQRSGFATDACIASDK